MRLTPSRGIVAPSVSSAGTGPPEFRCRDLDHPFRSDRRDECSLVSHFVLVCTPQLTLLLLLSSVTTIPAAAYLGVAAGLGQGSKALGALAVLATNVVMIVIAAAITLSLQRRLARSRNPP
jgi:hypothetical protein